MKTYLFTFYLILFTILSVKSQTLPLIQISDIEFQGAFRIPTNNFGESNANYSSCTMAYNESNNTIFLSGFRLHGSVAEFSIPELVNSTDLTKLNEATNLQGFRKILNSATSGNPQAIDEISGMEVINNQLFINALEYYDAPATNTHTTLVIEDKSNLATSTVKGYFAFEGAAHTAGWISEIPSEWQADLGGDYLTGNSSKYPINVRSTMGTSAFSFNSSDFEGVEAGNISTTTLLDFDLTNPIYADYESYEFPSYNLIEANGSLEFEHTFEDADAIVGENDLWTDESQASFGLIIPGTSSYLTIGSSGGHTSGIGYKPMQNNGSVCPGPCPYDTSDYHNYYWLWDVNDLLAVKNGFKNEYEIRPYAYGQFNIPFQIDELSGEPEFHKILGGAYNAQEGLIYLAIEDGSAIDGMFDKAPLIIAYAMTNLTLGVDQIEERKIQVIPNPGSNLITLNINNDELKLIEAYNQLGTKVYTEHTNKIHTETWPNGTYTLKVKLKNGVVINSKFIKI